jgi:glycosyltransferase involved in cell wall biosynthesis
MKLLLVNHLMDPVSGGGTAERTFQIARFLVRAGVSCTVLTLDLGITPARRAALGGAALVAAPCLNQRFFIPWISPKRVRELVAASDIVHLSGHWTLLNAMVYFACKRLRKPYLFCPAGALAPFGRSLRVKSTYERLVGRQLRQSAAACVAITEAERMDFAACGVPSERIAVIPNGIDIADYQVDNPNLASERFRGWAGVGDARFVLFLGRLNPIKGPDLLLEAFFALGERFRDLHLVLAGPDGGMQTELAAMAEKRGLSERVHFVGFVSGAQKVAGLRAAKLLAIPSRREAMSIVVLEGGICGCPVLFTDACGLDDIARQEAGTMVPASVSALTAALAHLLDDNLYRTAAAERLRDIVQRHYLWEAQAQRYLTLMKKIIVS